MSGYYHFEEPINLAGETVGGEVSDRPGPCDNQMQRDNRVLVEEIDRLRAENYKLRSFLGDKDGRIRAALESENERLKGEVKGWKVSEQALLKLLCELKGAGEHQVNCRSIGMRNCDVRGKYAAAYAQTLEALKWQK